MGREFVLIRNRPLDLRSQHFMFHVLDETYCGAASTLCGRSFAWFDTATLGKGHAPLAEIENVCKTCKRAYAATSDARRIEIIEGGCQP